MSEETKPVPEDYVPLKEAAMLMGVGYSTAHQYCIRDCLPGAVLRRGTRWYVHKRTIEAFNDNDLSVKGAFRKGN